MKNKQKGAALPIILVVVAVLIIGGVVFVSMGDKDTKTESAMEQSGEEAMMEKDGEVMMEKDGDAMEGKMEDGAMMEDSSEAHTSGMMEDGDAMKKMEASAGSYEDYSAGKLAMAEEGDVVLFFHANMVYYM